MSFTPPRITILFGSETGFAQEAAELMAREAQRRRYAPDIYAMDDFPIQQLPQEQLVVFVCSTTGQGDTPDNMKRFWRFLLRKSLSADALQGMRYAVFGLGDSSYTLYNAVAKRLYRRLGQLGGIALGPCGLGDDQHQLGLYGGPEGLDAWLEGLWEQVAILYPLPSHVHAGDPFACPEPCYLITKDNRGAIGGDSNGIIDKEDTVISSDGFYTLNNPFRAPLRINRRETALDHFQDVRHIELDISGSGIKYNVGDVVQVLPQTHPDIVQGMLDYLGVPGDTVLSIIPNPQAKGLRPACELRPPRSCSLRYLLTDYLEVNATPRRHFFNLAAHFATDPEEVERLQYFGSSDGQNDMMSYAHRARRTILETLLDFPSLRIPLEYLLDIMPRMRPRSFSICNSLKLHPDEIHMIVAVVKYRTFLHEPRRGVCSTWLQGLQATNSPDTPRVRIWTKPSTLKLPPTAVPVVLIGPGTGIAALRAIIQERVYLARQVETGKGKVGGVHLFVGNRSASKDWLYKDELQGYMCSSSSSKNDDGDDNRTQPVLQTYATAFSRDQEAKLYVQYRIREHGALLWQLMDQGAAWVIISGNAKAMPLDVRLAWKSVIETHGNRTEQEAEQVLRGWERVKRYQTETW